MYSVSAVVATSLVLVPLTVSLSSPPAVNDPVKSVSVPIAFTMSDSAVSSSSSMVITNVLLDRVYLASGVPPPTSAVVTLMATSL